MWRVSWRISSNSLPSRFPVGTKFVIEGTRSGEGQCRFSAVISSFPTARFSRCRRIRCSANRAPAAAPASRAGAAPRPLDGLGQLTEPRRAPARLGGGVGHWPTCKRWIAMGKSTGDRATENPRPPVGQGFRAIGQSPLKVGFEVDVSRRRGDNARSPARGSKDIASCSWRAVSADVAHDRARARIFVRLLPAQNKIVAVDHLGPPGKTEDRRGYPPTSGP